MTFRRSFAPLENTRIDSWKEIAVFFGRDERTVKRWERERALPIHRLPGERGGVFAYSDELTRWLNSTSATTPAPGAKREPVSIGLAVMPDLSDSDSDDEPATKAESAQPVAESPTLPAAHMHARLFWGAVGACVAVVALGGLLAMHRYQAKRHGATLTTASSHGHVPDSEALQFYLKGRYYWYRRTSGSLSQALDSFTQAVVHDSEYAQAYAGLAESYDLMPEYTPMAKSEAFPRAIAAANKALALDDSLSEAHGAMGFAQFYWEWNAPRAFAEFERALQLDPSNADARHWYATSLLTVGRGKEALAEIDRAQQLDPTSRSILADQAMIRYQTGNQAGATAALQEIERNEPDFQAASHYLANLAYDRGDVKVYLAESKRYVAISNDPQARLVYDAANRGWQRGGQRGMFEEIRKVQLNIFESGQSTGFELAHTCGMLGRKQEAIMALKAAYNAHDYQVITVLSAEWTLPLRGDPEFDQLRNQIARRLNRQS